MWDMRRTGPSGPERVIRAPSASKVWDLYGTGPRSGTAGATAPARR